MFPSSRAWCRTDAVGRAALCSISPQHSEAATRILFTFITIAIAKALFPSRQLMKWPRKWWGRVNQYKMCVLTGQQIQELTTKRRFRAFLCWFWRLVSHFFKYKCILITVSFICVITALTVITEGTMSCLCICQRSNHNFFQGKQNILQKELSPALCCTLFILSAGCLYFNRSQIF